MLGMCSRLSKIHPKKSYPEAINLIKTLCRFKSVRLDLDDKKTFSKEMKLLSTVLQRGNSLMFTNKNIDFINDQDISSDISPNLLWFKYNKTTKTLLCNVMYAPKITSIPNIFMIILSSTFSRKKKDLRQTRTLQNN